MTSIIRADIDRDCSSELAVAGGIVARGGVAVFPTETVYGIGVSIRCNRAARRLLDIKMRPQGMALLVHCSNTNQVYELAAGLPDAANRLVAEFWPGPLALVLKAGENAPGFVVGPDDTVGVRMVDHPVTIQLIDAVGAPIAGTSANLHGQPAPARFEAIEPNLLDRTDVALNAGRCRLGIPSTLLDLAHGEARILRVGAIAPHRIEAVLGKRLT